jgi:hypothetical protein
MPAQATNETASISTPYDRSGDLCGVLAGSQLRIGKSIGTAASSWKSILSI